MEAKTIASKTRIFKDSLSVPKIIGNGPTKIIPPPLTFSAFPIPRSMNRKNAAIITAMPANIKANPIYVNRFVGSMS